MIFPSLRLKARIVFRPLKEIVKKICRKGVVLRPVVVKNELVGLIEDGKDVKDTFCNLRYW